MRGVASSMQRPAQGKHGFEARSLPWPKTYQIAIGFFLLFFLYVWLRIEPAVEYQSSALVFQLTLPFLKSFLERPGGLLDYTAAGMSQLNYYNWLGALAFTLLAWLLWLVTRRVLGTVAGVSSGAAAFGVPFLLLLLRDRYDCPALDMGTGLLAAVALALVYSRLLPSGVRPSSGAATSGRSRAGSDQSVVAAPEDGRTPALSRLRSSTWLRLAACWGASWLLFYLAGAWPCVVLLLLIGLFEGLHQHRKCLGLAYALPLPVAVWWLVRLHELNQAALLNPWCKRTEDWILGGALYLFVPLAGVFSAVAALPSLKSENRNPKSDTNPKHERGNVQDGRPGLRRAAGASRAPAAATSAPHSDAAFRALGHSLFGVAPGFGSRISVLGLCLLGWVLVWFGLATPRKQVAEMDYYTRRGDYERVLAVARRLPGDQMEFPSEVRLHLALYHTGRLGQDLFSYRNQSQWELLPGLGGGLTSCRAQSRTLMELGLVSEAEHLAHEALENDGERPELLQRLAQVNVLKDRPKAARVFLNVLSTVPFQESWARSWLRSLDQDPRLTGNPELQAIRSLMPTNDLAHEALPAEGLLVQLLRCNSTNQMAFEYLMAKFLMDSQLNKFVERLGQLDNFKYASLPRHYEEAVLLYETLSHKPVDMHGRSIRPETAERFRRFMDAMNQHVMDTEQGRQTMTRDFGDTYWYYFFGRRAAASLQPKMNTDEHR
jgi:hypothetical protein